MLSSAIVISVALPNGPKAIPSQDGTNSAPYTATIALLTSRQKLGKGELRGRMSQLSMHCTSGGIPDKMNACGTPLVIIGQGEAIALVCPKCDCLPREKAGKFGPTP